MCTRASSSKQGTADAARLISFLNDDLLKGGKKKVRTDSGVGIKPISIFGTKRLVRYAIHHALETGRKTVTLVHKGNIQKFTEGAFREWGYEVATRGVPRPDRDRARELDSRQRRSQPRHHHRRERRAHRAGPRVRQPGFRESLYAEIKGVLDSIGKIARQRRVEVEDPGQRPHRRLHLPADHHSPVGLQHSGHTNLNGDYISDAAAAQVGGLGIAPGANIGDGYAVFEATHGTAPKYADKDVINPGSVILSGVMLLDFIGWKEAAKMIETAMEKTIQQKFVTYDFERQTAGATKVGTSEFATRIIGNM